MKLEKLLWSKTKTDILKYLIFWKEWISIRYLETRLNRSFPAIRKQIDILEKAGVIEIDKENNSWAIYLKKDFKWLLKKIFLFALQEELLEIIKNYNDIIKDYYLWKLFWFSELPTDLVLIYQKEYKSRLDKIKKEIDKLFESYFINVVQITTLNIQEYWQRYRAWDKFVILLQNKWWKTCI